MGAIGLAAAGTAGAGVGRVISSTPVVQQVAVPRQVCNQQIAAGPAAHVGRRRRDGRHRRRPARQHGRRRLGRAAATGVGVVAGAAVGNNIERRNQYAAQPARSARTQTTYENRTVGYNVQYEYAGKQYNVQMPYDPGPTVKLQSARGVVRAGRGWRRADDRDPRRRSISSSRSMRSSRSVRSSRSTPAAGLRAADAERGVSRPTAIRRTPTGRTTGGRLLVPAGEPVARLRLARRRRRRHWHR